MFYAYVRNLPMIRQELKHKASIEMLDFERGYIRQLMETSLSSTFVVRDLRKGVSYRASSFELLVSRGGDGNRPFQQVRIGKPKGKSGIMVPADFKDLDAREDILNFIDALSEMQSEYDERNSTMERLKKWIKDPVAKLFLLAAICYAIVTVFLLFYG